MADIIENALSGFKAKKNGINGLEQMAYSRWRIAYGLIIIFNRFENNRFFD